MASIKDQLTVEQLKEKIEKEYKTAIELIHTISSELQLLKFATSPGSDFEANIIENADLMLKLVEMGQLELSDLKPATDEENVNSGRIPAGQEMDHSHDMQV